jgi:transcriptional regulator with XRE-family HTH domain
MAGEEDAVLDDAAFRGRLAELLRRTGLSQRALSTAFGRDPGYVQALLDPTRPSRARPTPSDLLHASDALGIGFVELLEQLWDVPPGRLASELGASGSGLPLEAALARLTPAERRSVADFVGYLAQRHARGERPA